MNNLKNLRVSSGVSQQTVATYLGITRQAYSHYETGRREPDMETLLKLGDFFNCSVDCLLRGPASVRMVESWHDDMWEDWNNAKDDSTRKRILQVHGVPPQLSGEYIRLFEQKETPAEKSADVSDEDIMFALSGGEGTITEAQFEEVKKFVQFIKERDRNDQK